MSHDAVKMVGTSNGVPSQYPNPYEHRGEHPWGGVLQYQYYKHENPQMLEDTIKEEPDDSGGDRQFRSSFESMSAAHTACGPNFLGYLDNDYPTPAGDCDFSLSPKPAYMNGQYSTPSSLNHSGMPEDNSAHYEHHQQQQQYYGNDETGQTVAPAPVTQPQHCIQKGKNPFKCPDCSKSFAKKEKLDKHALTHTKCKPYQCDGCFKRFSSMKGFTEHRYRHTGEKPYTCPKCSERFPTKYKQQKHLRIHDQTPHQCSDCYKQFATVERLREHMYIHTGQRAYSCHHCNREFVTCAEFDEDQFRHSGQRPHDCKECGMASFASPEGLQEHMQIHNANVF